MHRRQQARVLEPVQGRVHGALWQIELPVAAGAQIEGPAIVQEMSSATIVPPHGALKVDAIGNLPVGA